MQKKLFLTNTLPAQRGSSRKVRDRTPSARTLALCSTAEARDKIPYDLAVRLQILPLTVTPHAITVACNPVTEENHRSELLKSLQFAASMPVELREGKECDLEQAIFIAYGKDQRQLVTKMDLLKKAPEMSYSPPDSRWQEPEGAEYQFLKSLIHYAASSGASDIYLTPRRDGAYVRIRIQSELHHHPEPLCSLKRLHAVLRVVKVLSALDPSITRTPQDGALQITVEGSEIQCRLSFVPSIHGEQLVIRLANHSPLIPLCEFGFHPTTLSVLQNLSPQKSGLVLFSGATGSGKTTAMYALINNLLQSNCHIISVEDPVEQEVPGITQVSVDNRTEVTFGSTLRAVLRQSPDIILIGEIRDRESAQIAVDAAQTGHLVVSSLHSDSICSIPLRLNGLGIPPIEISDSLILTISLQLVRTLCCHCRVIDLASSRQVQASIYQPVGCHSCNYAGFDGRHPVEETLLWSKSLCQLLASGVVAPSLLAEKLSESNYLPAITRAEELLRKGTICYADYQVLIEK